MELNFLQAVFNSSDNINLFVLDTNYCYLFFNQRHKAVMQAIWNVEISTGANMLDFISDEADRHKAKCNFEHVLQDNEFVEIEEYGNAEPNRAFYENHYYPLKENRKVIGIVVSVKDVSKQRKADLEILEQQSLLSSINTNIQEGIYRSTPNRGIIYVNKPLLEMFGYDTMEEFSALPSEKLYKNPNTRKHIIDKMIRHGKYANEEVEFMRKNGTSFWGLMSGLIVEGNNGEIFYDGAIRDITKEREIQKAYEESEKLLKSINQNINEGIYRANKSGLIYVNKAFIEMFGFDSGVDAYEYPSKALYKNQEDRQRLVDMLTKEGKFENVEVEMLRKDGSEFLGLLSSNSFVGSDGEMYWDGAIRDITDERKATLSIKENEQLLKSINQNINEAIYRSSSEKGLIYVNDAFAYMFGYSSVQEVLNEEAINLYKNPKSRDELGDELIQIGYIENKEVEFQRKDGTCFWGNMSSITVQGENGEVFFDGAIRDITKQKESERLLQRETELQRLLMNLSSKFINLPLEQVDKLINDSLKELGEYVGADRSYIFEYNFNKGFCTNTYEWCAEGIKPYIDDLQELPLSIIEYQVREHKKRKEFIIESVDQFGQEKFRNLLQEEGINSIVTIPLYQSAALIGFVGFDWVKQRFEFNENINKLLQVFANLLVSIRMRTERQRELRTLLETTANQNKRLKDFSFMTSHNIRSSVANMLGLVSLLHDNPEDTEILSMLETSAERLDITIKNVSDLLHFENDIKLNEKKSCNVLDSVERIIQMNDMIVQQKGIEIQTMVPDNLEVLAMPAYIDSIFHNLISNAFKYGISEKSNKVELSAKKNENTIVFTVKDFGLGIDLDANRDKLFKLGSRFHSEHGEGEGMGLFMTNYQVELLGGKIDVQSQPNKGTTFTVSLPSV